MNRKCSEGVWVISIIIITVSLWNLFTIISSNFLFLHSILAEKGKAVYDATSYSEIYRKIMINILTNSLLWVLLIFSAISTIKLKNFGRLSLLFMSYIYLILFFIYPLANYIIHFKKGDVISLEPLLVLYVVAIWFLSKETTRSQFRNKGDGSIF